MSDEQRFTSAEMGECFPDADLLVAPQDVLPDGLQDPELRRLLTEVGIPSRFTDAIEMNSDISENIETVEEAYARHGDRAPDAAGDLYFIGFAAGKLLCVDGENGATFQVSSDVGIQPLASHLARFFRVLCFLAREIERGSGRPSRRTSSRRSGGFQQRALQEHQRIDETASQGSAAAWRLLIDQILDSEEL